MEQEGLPFDYEVRSRDGEGHLIGNRRIKEIMKQNGIQGRIIVDNDIEYQFDDGTILVQGEDELPAFISIFPVGEKRDECQRQIAQLKSQLENLTGYELRGL